MRHNLEMYLDNKVLFAVVSLCLPAGCVDPGARNSAIVREVERAGAGDVSTITLPEMTAWFVNHNDRNLIARVAGECAPLRARADSHWAFRTAEGRVCLAAGQLNIPQHFATDSRQFGNVPSLK